MKKRIVISVIIIVLLVIFLSGGIFLIKKNTNTHKVSKEPESGTKTIDIKKEEEKAKTVEKTEKREQTEQKIAFENMNVLEQYFSAEQIENLKDEVESFLKQDEIFDSISKITCTNDVYETENQIKFYFTLDDGTVLFTSYKKESEEFFFWTEVKEFSESAKASWLQQKESETKAVDTSSWEEEQKLPKAWEENGEEDIPVKLTGKENLQGKIPDDALNNLETEMQKFLDGNNELRREISIPADKIGQTEDTVTFEADFKTERIDKKHLQVTYHIAEKKFGFSFE
ncbi:DUF5038 domain-containing protein [Firmicutes bacterium OM07-11]|nr:DUF5038 domain-containing protein [Firmicutes bacterium OM07-11]